MRECRHLPVVVGHRQQMASLQQVVVAVVLLTNSGKPLR